MESDATPTRATLLLRIRERSDREAWREFVELYTPLLHTYAAVKGVVPQDRDDVVQEVLRTVTEAIQRFEYDRSKGAFRAWLFIVTRSKVAKHFRSLARRPQAAGGTVNRRMIEEQPAQEEEQHWEMEYRRRMFEWAAPQVQAQVQEKTWRAFWLTMVEGKPTQEVARMLDMTPGTLYVARSRVIARLRSCIERVAGDRDPNLV